MARTLLLQRRSSVHTVLTPLLVTEVFDSVGQVHGFTSDARDSQSAIEHLSRWADEGPPCPVLLIARLLAHDHQFGVSGPLPEHGLRRALVKIAALALADS